MRIVTAQLNMATAKPMVHAVVENGWAGEEITACLMRMGHSYSNIERREIEDVNCPKCIAELKSGVEHPVYVDNAPATTVPPKSADAPAPRHAEPRSESPKKAEPAKPPLARKKEQTDQGSLF